MSQGNPFGPKGGRWMTATKLRSLFSAGLTYDEIAEANERSEGWKPSRAAVKRKYEAMGMPPRRPSHKDLIPWKLKKEHSDSVFRHMLQAESRSRQHKPLSDTDKVLTARLHEMLFGRGRLMVIGYHPDVGFYTTERTDEDDDIIRAPKKAAPPVTPEALENEGRDAEADRLRELVKGPTAVVLTLDADSNPLAQDKPERTVTTTPRPRRRRAGRR